MVRFDARPALDGTLPAGRTANFPVTVQGPAATAPTSLRAEASYDEGRTRHPLRIRNGRADDRTPAKGTMTPEVIASGATGGQDRINKPIPHGRRGPR